MMGATLRRGAVCAALLLAGCGRSPQTRVLTLDALPPPAQSIRGDYRGPPLAIPAVHVPAAIDRPEYVSQPSPGEVKIEDFAQWAAPLGLLARDALVRDLTARLPAGRVLPPGATGGAGAQVVDVTILALDLRSGTSTLQAAYRLLPGGPVHQAVLTTQGDGAGPAAGAQTFAVLLAQLADRIVVDLPAR